MKLKEFNVREFQSVWESGPIKVDEITCLVGKNEAGKTSLLKALYRLNPISNVDANFNVTDDYPRKEVSDYEHEVKSGHRSPATITEVIFVLEDDDVKAITGVFGEAALTSHSITYSKDYENRDTYEFALDEQAARSHLADTANLPEPLRERLRAARDWKAFGEALEETETTTEVTQLKELLAKFGGTEASDYAFSGILKSRIPKFYISMNTTKWKDTKISTR
jgi:predicted ATP-binding protein involved in virulence